MPTVPVRLNGTDVLKETPVPDKSIITLGSCNFRFLYRDGFSSSPLLEVNKPSFNLTAKVRITLSSSSIKCLFLLLFQQRRKSTGTRKRKEKENVATPKARKSLPCPSISSSSAKQLATPPALSRSMTEEKDEEKCDHPVTPASVPGSKKKNGRVPTPTIARVSRSSTSRSSFSSLSSSLYSITEEVQPLPLMICMS